MLYIHGYLVREVLYISPNPPLYDLERFEDYILYMILETVDIVQSMDMLVVCASRVVIYEGNCDGCFRRGHSERRRSLPHR